MAGLEYQYPTGYQATKPPPYFTTYEPGLTSTGYGADARSVTSSDAGLGSVLSTFGAPSEWWHDSIILGRLSALALRYFAAKATSRPWRAWKLYVDAGRADKLVEKRRRVLLALRSWRWRALTRGRLRNKLPLILQLKQLELANLKPAWERLKQVVFLKRDVSRRLRLLDAIQRKIMGMMAMAHYHQSLLRLGLGGFWMATQLSTSAARTGSGSRGRGRAAVTDGSHVEQVVRRAWRRWSFATRLWLSSTEYQVRETEAWLAGECRTPRSIARSLRSPQGIAGASPGHAGSPMVLDSAGPTMDALSGTAFEFPSVVHEPFPELASRQWGEEGAPVYLNATTTLDSSSRSRLTYQQARSTSAGRRYRGEPEKPLTEPPHRRDPQEAMSLLAATAAPCSSAPYGRPLGPVPHAGSAARSSIADLRFVAADSGEDDEEAPLFRSEDAHTVASRAAAQRVAAWRSSGSSYGDLLAPHVSSPARFSHADAEADASDDYWQMRSRMGPRVAPARSVTPVKLRQR
mmetsp:Transcript_17302/g.38972  ORF Transcript_17302/g.38972 Transcript_17302/m.38972 type:complete len:518 (+) Transcript_17302:55-1608(+)